MNLKGVCEKDFSRLQGHEMASALPQKIILKSVTTISVITC